MLTTSKLTSKFQATFPMPVREALHLRPGDLVGFEVIGRGADVKVLVKRATPLDVAFAQALEGTLDEWHSAADDEAFKGL